MLRLPVICLLELDGPDCLWVGAAELCALDPAGRRRLWTVELPPERFGRASHDGAGVERPLRREAFLLQRTMLRR
jgi:hypothetical protein